MRIGGLQKCSLIDYPGKIAAVIFTQGCPWRCAYCHNASLVLPDCFGPLLPEDEVLGFLKTRCNKLDGVVVTGGEPTIHPDLSAFLKKLKSLGFEVKLDTNGFRPEVIEKLILSGSIDYIAMDVKAPLNKYESVIRVPVAGEKIQQSIALIRDSGLDHEFRTTALPSLHTREDIHSIVCLVAGARRFVLQTFVGKEPLCPALKDQPPFPRHTCQLWADEFASTVGEFLIR